MKDKALKIAVGSGKGGTGKTTISVNLAAIIKEQEELQLVDCDVEAPNDALFFSEKKLTDTKKVGIKVPIINEDKCTYCGICADVCEYNAIVIISKTKKSFIANDLCHGCGACSYFCPVNAITEVDNNIGTISKYKIGNIDLIEGRLDIAESMPTPILRQLKREIKKDKLTILDSPPGTSCSFIQTVNDADFVIMVTEPTPFGLYDLRLAVKIVKKMGKRLGIVINRSDIGDKKLFKFIDEEKIPVLMEIPFDKEIAEIYSNGELIVDRRKDYREKFLQLYNKIREMLK